MSEEAPEYAVTAQRQPLPTPPPSQFRVYSIMGGGAGEMRTAVLDSGALVGAADERIDVGAIVTVDDVNEAVLVCEAAPVLAAAAATASADQPRPEPDPDVDRAVREQHMLPDMGIVADEHEAARVRMQPLYRTADAQALPEVEHGVFRRLQSVDPRVITSFKDADGRTMVVCVTETGLVKVAAQLVLED